MMWFFTLILLPAALAQECDLGWKNFRRDCYLYVDYENSSDKGWIDYGTAVEECANLGAQLSSVTNHEEMKFIASLVPTPTINSRFNALPLLALVKIDKWRNPFNWNEKVFEQWCQGEPNNFEGEEQCVSLGPNYLGLSIDKKPCFYDVNCRGVNKWERGRGFSSFICKKELTWSSEVTKQPSSKRPQTTPVSTSGCTDPNAVKHDGNCVCRENYVDIKITDALENKNYSQGQWCIPQNPCGNVKDLSINFIVDSSESIGKENWLYLIKFLRNAADSLPKSTKVSFIKFAADVTFADTLQPGWNRKAFNNFIPKKYDNGSTNTPVALAKAIEMFKNDSSKNKVALLLTDGEPKIDTVDYGEERLEFIEITKDEASKLRSNGVSLVAFGYGPSLKIASDVIKQFVEDPEEDYFEFRNNASELTPIHMNILLNKACSRFLP